MLLFSHQDLEPDPILSVDSCQRGAKARDSTLRLLDIILEKVSIDDHVNHLFVLQTIGDKHAETIAQGVID